MIAAAGAYSREDQQKGNEEEKENHVATEISASARSLANGFAGSLVFAADRFEDRINSIGEAAFVIAVVEARVDAVLANIERSDVGQRAFQTVADLNRSF